MNRIVMPGDRITNAEELAKSKKIILGPGLRRAAEQVLATKAGVLHHKAPNTFWVDNYQRRYVPTRGDTVVGVVKAKTADTFRVDIGSSDLAYISYLAFEAASKKNRPEVNAGDLIFARVVNASRDIEPELVCVNSTGKKGKLGLLQDGFVITTSLNLARRILRPECPLLPALNKEMPYEIAVGLNGRIWVKAETMRETVGLANAILCAERTTYKEMEEICENMGNLLYT